MKNSKKNQLFSTCGLEFDLKEPQNNRAKVDTGTLCNYHCEFCYYKDKLKEKDSLENVKKRVDALYRFGIREFDLSGGEPSILPYFFDILDYCSKFGTVSCLSNGFKFADINFCKKAKEHGLNEILFSLHGSNPEIHDKIVGKTLAFKNLIQAIKNCQKLGIRVRINCTVYDKNYQLLGTEYADLINNLKPFEVNFIQMNYFDGNSDYQPLKLDVLCSAIKTCIDKIKDNVKLINVRYVPFCYMQGYEKYQTNYYQLLYDIYDWNIPSYTFNVEKLKECDQEQRLKVGFDAAKQNRCNGFVKPDECKQCRYFFICDGLKKGLENINDVYPVEGQKITDINYFRHGFFE